jgi:threonine synthase
MGRVLDVRCPRCDKPAPADGLGACADCGVVFDVRVDLAAVPPLSEIRKRPETTIWRWRDLLPIQDPRAVVSLGEGGTPLVEARRLGTLIGIPRLLVKNDGLLPTGSLKDRVMSAGVSRAREIKARTVATPSTGNAAASLAAYAAAAGLDCVVFVPEGTAPAKMVQAQACGARVMAVSGPFENASSLARQAVASFGWYSTLSDNPYRNDGMKSYGYEIWEQLGGVPDWMIHPEASGGAVAGAWKAFGEMRALGWVSRRPRMAAAQARAAAALVQAWEAGREDVEALTPGPTVAEAIRVGRPRLGWQALRAIRESGGATVAVTDEEILESQRLLAAQEGIFAEPSGAVSVAAARRLRQAGTIREGDLVVAVVTGHGLKQPEASATPPALLIEPTLDALERALKEP